LGCVASGSSKEEVRKNIHDAIEFHLEGMELEGEFPPIMATEAEMLEFA
jgi:predicted RNase H-like HicB family nuclease